MEYFEGDLYLNKAYELLSSSARNNIYESHYHLAILRSEPYNDDHYEPVTAMKHMEIAALHDTKKAQQILGESYLTGFGVKQSKTHAWAWIYVSGVENFNLLDQFEDTMNNTEIQKAKELVNEFERRMTYE